MHIICTDIIETMPDEYTPYYVNIDLQYIITDWHKIVNSPVSSDIENDSTEKSWVTQKIDDLKLHQINNQLLLSIVENNELKLQSIQDTQLYEKEQLLYSMNAIFKILKTYEVLWNIYEKIYILYEVANYFRKKIYLPICLDSFYMHNRFYISDNFLIYCPPYMSRHTKIATLPSFITYIVNPYIDRYKELEDIVERIVMCYIKNSQYELSKKNIAIIDKYNINEN